MSLDALATIDARRCAISTCANWTTHESGVCPRCRERGFTPPPAPAGLHSIPKPPLGEDLRENDVQDACIGVLVADGWTVRRCGTWRADYAGSDEGIPDLIALKPGAGVLFVECKRSKGGVQSDEQQEFQRDCIAAGERYILTNSAHHLRAQLVELKATVLDSRGT